MAESATFLELKNKLIERAAELNSFSAAATNLYTDGDRATFIAIFDLVKEAKENASDQFNALMSRFVNIYETLLSVTYADLYIRRAIQDIYLINNCVRIIKQLTSENIKNQILSLKYLSDYQTKYLGEVKRLESEIKNESNNDKKNELINEKIKYEDLLVETEERIKGTGIPFFDSLKESIDIYIADGAGLSYDPRTLSELIAERKTELENAIASEIADINKKYDDELKTIQSNPFKFLWRINIEFRRRCELSMARIKAMIRIGGETPKLINLKKMTEKIENIPNTSQAFFYKELIMLNYYLEENYLEDGVIDTRISHLTELTTYMNSFSQALLQIMGIALQHAFDCIYSWEYIEAMRKAQDGYYFEEFIQDMTNHIADLKAVLTELQAIDMQTVLNSDTDELRIKMMSTLQVILADINSIQNDSLDAIELLRKEKENYEVIFSLEDNYGNAIRDMSELIDEIYNNLDTVVPVSNQTEIEITDSVIDVLSEQNANASFMGSQFLVPYFVTADEENGDLILSTFARWESELRIQTGVNDQIENMILFYISNFLAKYIPTIESDSVEIKPSNETYERMQNTALDNILLRKLFEIPRETLKNNPALQKRFEKYNQLREKQRILKLDNLLEVKADFENDQLSPEITLLFPKLTPLSYIRYENIINKYLGGRKSVNPSYNSKLMSNEDYEKAMNNIKFTIYNAFLSESKIARDKKLGKLLDYFKNRKFESVKDLYLAITIYPIASSLLNTNDSDDGLKQILSDYMEIYEYFYGNEAMNIAEVIDGTKLGDFASGETNKILFPDNVNLNLSLNLLPTLMENDTKPGSELGNLERIRSIMYGVMVKNEENV